MSNEISNIDVKSIPAIKEDLDNIAKVASDLQSENITADNLKDNIDNLIELKKLINSDDFKMLVDNVIEMAKEDGKIPKEHISQIKEIYNNLQRDDITTVEEYEEAKKLIDQLKVEEEKTNEKIRSIVNIINPIEKLQRFKENFDERFKGKDFKNKEKLKLIKADYERLINSLENAINVNFIFHKYNKIKNKSNKLFITSEEFDNKLKSVLRLMRTSKLFFLSPTDIYYTLTSLNLMNNKRAIIFLNLFCQKVDSIQFNDNKHIAEVEEVSYFTQFFNLLENEECNKFNFKENLIKRINEYIDMYLKDCGIEDINDERLNMYNEKITLFEEAFKANIAATKKEVEELKKEEIKE